MTALCDGTATGPYCWQCYRQRRAWRLTKSSNGCFDVFASELPAIQPMQWNGFHMHIGRPPANVPNLCSACLCCMCRTVLRVAARWWQQHPRVERPVQIHHGQFLAQWVSPHLSGSQLAVGLCICPRGRISRGLVDCVTLFSALNQLHVTSLVDASSECRVKCCWLG
jgi:hypothetical protein